MYLNKTVIDGFYGEKKYLMGNEEGTHRRKILLRGVGEKLKEG